MLGWVSIYPVPLIRVLMLVSNPFDYYNFIVYFNFVYSKSLIGEKDELFLILIFSLKHHLIGLPWWRSG